MNNFASTKHEAPTNPMGGILKNESTTTEPLP